VSCNRQKIPVKANVVSLVILALTLAQVTCEHAEETPLPEFDFLLSRNYDGVTPIYGYVIGNDNPTRLTQNAYSNSPLGFSNDGKWILYITRDMQNWFELNLMDGNGENVTLLDRSESSLYHPNAQFVPDDSKVVYAISADIYIVNIDGSNKRNLTRSNDSESPASVSRDGSKILYHKFSQTPQTSDIWIMNIDGSDKNQLTSSLGDSVLYYSSWFSPLGDEILYWTHRDDQHYLCSMDIDGSNPMEISGPYEQSPAVRHDNLGLSILYSLDWDIWFMHPDGSGETQITNDNYYNMNPFVSRDGTAVYYVSQRDGAVHVYSVELNGSEPALIPNTAGASYLFMSGY